MTMTNTIRLSRRRVLKAAGATLALLWLEAMGAKLLQRDRSILDLNLGQSKDLKRKLGRTDVTRLDEYFGSVRELEKRIAVNEGILDEPLPEVDRKELRPIPTKW